MIEERTPALVLRTRLHSESDKIVTFMTRDWGKVTGIAKGAKRSQRRFVNVLEPFTHIQLRFRPGRADDLAFIFGCDLIRSFRAPARNVQRYAIANYLAELMDAMIAGREPGGEAYELLLQGLTTLEEQAPISSFFLSAFELFLLTYTGYGPNVASCQRCGLSVDDPDSIFVFSPNAGGLLCTRCRADSGAATLLSPETLALLAAPQEEDLIRFLATVVSPRAGRELRTVVSSLLARHIPRPLKSKAFLEQTGVLDSSLVDGPYRE